MTEDEIGEFSQIINEGLNKEMKEGALRQKLAEQAEFLTEFTKSPSVSPEGRQKWQGIVDVLLEARSALDGAVLIFKEITPAMDATIKENEKLHQRLAEGTDDDGGSVLAAAYLALLALPKSAGQLKAIQPTLDRCRDLIATQTGAPPSFVQREFEVEAKDLFQHGQ